ADAGFDRLLVITGHGGNLSALGVVQPALLATHPDFVFAYAPVSGLATEATAALPRTEVSGHCGESETSQMLAIDESLVDSGHLNPGATRLDDLDPRARLSRTKSPSTAVTFDRYADNGVLGDPRTATAAAGEDILGEVVDRLSAYCQELQGLCPPLLPARPPGRAPHPRPPDSSAVITVPGGPCPKIPPELSGAHNETDPD